MAGRGGARRGRSSGGFPALALLLSVMVSCFDRGVQRKRRGGRPRSATTKWWDFRLPVPPPPPPPQPKCSDCGTTTTPQWRTGPMGPRTLCNNCGGRRRLAGEQWGKPRPRRNPRAPPATAVVHDQPPAQQVSPPPVPASPPSARICEQGLASDPEVFLVKRTVPRWMTSPPPPATDSLPAPAPAMSPATDFSDQPTPLEIIRPVPESPPSNPICEQGLVSSPNVLLERSSSPNPVTPPPPATKPFPAPATAVSDHPPPPPEQIPPVLALVSPPTSQICEQGLVRVPDVLLGTTSPNPMTPPAPATAGRDELPPLPAISAGESSASGTRRKRWGKRRWMGDRTCDHCGSTTTPQWRGGPEGLRMLCNACGVRFRQGRLLPEYRPKASPTFDDNLHTSLHSEVLRRRRRQRNRNNAPPVPVTLPLLPPPELPVTVEPSPAANDDDSANNDSMPLLLLPPPELPVAVEPSPAANGDDSANNDSMPLPPLPRLGRPRLSLHELRAVPMPRLLMPPPPPRPVVNLASEPCVLATEDDPANLEELPPLDPFLLDGPAAPMLVEEEDEPRLVIYL